MNILVLNCGSSSLKYQLINMDDESVIAKGLVERIGIEGSILTHKPIGKDKYVVETPMKDHNIAVKLVLDALMDAEHGVIKSTDEIAAVGHRVLHAGEKYIESCIVTEDVKKVVRECFDLGPLHNPANLIGIEAVEAAMPGKPNVAVWDTAFGGTMEPKGDRRLGRTVPATPPVLVSRICTSSARAISPSAVAFSFTVDRKSVV